ncbi:type I-E CRISPR-associated protein Cse2/CasB [bacterium]|nr:MAG: type I-E CRISPR-associated protein Cse2/CasB [bacterium]
MPDYLTKEQSAFLMYLTSLNTDANRGTLAVLRRGLAGNPIEDLNLYRFVAWHIPDSDRGTVRESAYYLVAALYALHPLSTDAENLGGHMKLAAQRRNDVEAAERRFTVLLNASMTDLAMPLRQAMTMLKQLVLPVNWTALFAGLLHWDNPDKVVQRAWANSFWAYDNRAENETTNQPVENK